MSTQKIEFSLRLRHDTADLSQITEQLGIEKSVIWNKGEPKAPSSNSGELKFEFSNSYCSLALGVAATTNLEDGIADCVAILQPKSAEIVQFVRSGGMASLAVAWYSSAVGGDRIPVQLLTELVRMQLTLDIYLYLSPSSTKAT